MNLATLIISALIFIPMIVIVVRGIGKLKRGESSCGCGCSKCSQAGACNMAQREKDNHQG